MDAEARNATKSGDAAYYDQRWSDAVRHYERAVDLSRVARTAAVYRNLGHVLNQLGRWPDALFASTRAIELDDRQAVVWVNRSIAHNSLGRFAEAVVDASRALTIDPEYAPALRNRRTALHAAGLHASALNDPRRWAELRPKDPFAHECLAFEANCVDGPALLTTSDAVLTAMGVSDVVHRNRLLSGIAVLRMGLSDAERTALLADLHGLCCRRRA